LKAVQTEMSMAPWQKIKLAKSRKIFTLMRVVCELRHFGTV